MGFVGSARLDGERVNVGLEHIRQRRVHLAMAREQGLSGKRRRDDAHMEMPAPVASACVTGESKYWTMRLSPVLISACTASPGPIGR